MSKYELEDYKSLPFRLSTLTLLKSDCINKEILTMSKSELIWPLYHQQTAPLLLKMCFQFETRSLNYVSNSDIRTKVFKYVVV